MNKSLSKTIITALNQIRSLQPKIALPKTKKQWQSGFIKLSKKLQQKTRLSASSLTESNVGALRSGLSTSILPKKGLSVKFLNVNPGKAHYLASDTFRKIKKPSKIVTAEEVMKIIFPSKKTGYSSISGTEGS